jgi:hypothetical protein
LKLNEERKKEEAGLVVSPLKRKTTFNESNRKKLKFANDLKNAD